MATSKENSMSTETIAPHVLDAFIASALKELGRESFVVLPEKRIDHLKEIMHGLSAAIARAEKAEGDVRPMPCGHRELFRMPDSELDPRTCALCILKQERERIIAERDHLQNFKAYVHKRLDDAGVPKFYDGRECRVGARLDLVIRSMSALGERDATKAMAVGILRAVDAGRLDSRSMASDALLSWTSIHFDVNDGSGIKRLRDETGDVRLDDATRELLAATNPLHTDRTVPLIDCGTTALPAEIDARLAQLHNLCRKKAKEYDALGITKPAGDLLGVAMCLRDIAGHPVEGPVPLDPNRCAACGWPLKENAADGCVRANCSQRPHPVRLYDPERFELERAEAAKPCKHEYEQVGIKLVCVHCQDGWKETEGNGPHDTGAAISGHGGY